MKLTTLQLVALIICVELIFNGAMAGIYHVLTTNHFDKVIGAFVFNWWMLFGIPGMITYVLAKNNVKTV